MYSDFLGMRRLPQPPLKNATLHLPGVTRFGLETRSSSYFLDLAQSEPRQHVTSQAFILIQSTLFFIHLYKNAGLRWVVYSIRREVHGRPRYSYPYRGCFPGHCITRGNLHVRPNVSLASHATFPEHTSRMFGYNVSQPHSQDSHRRVFEP